MKYGYKELKGKCKTCYLKCFRLEALEFNGVERCEYYTKEEKDEIVRTNRRAEQNLNGCKQEKRYSI